MCEIWLAVRREKRRGVNSAPMEDEDLAHGPLPIPRAVLRRRMNNELNFSPNFEGLVLGCIDADFCK